MDMKQFTVALLFILCLLGETYSQNLSSTEKKATQVTLHGVTAQQPRNGLEISVVCYYYDGVLYLDFSEHVQNASILVTQTTTGEQFYTDRLDCNQQSISLDVPHSSGQYYVVVEYESSVLYGYYYL